MQLPGGEPKDGDFVAYLAEIERRQLAQEPVPADWSTADPARQESAAARTLTRGEAGALRERLASAKGLPAALVGNIVLGVVGLFLLLLGAVGDGGFIAAAIGVVLIWRAVKSLRDELRKTTTDLRATVAKTFNSRNTKSR